MQLMVEGRPFLILGGELHNSDSSSLEYMKQIWPRISELNLNTLLTPISWELIEPQEGHFDFTLLDGIVSAARQYRLRLVLLWLGTWKNGVSTYAPLWVKTDTERFPRVKDARGRSLDAVSPLSIAARDADAKAFGAVMQHIRQIDKDQHTVLMVQVENEVGLLGPSRDHSAQAEQAWKWTLPAGLVDYLNGQARTLLPELAKLLGTTPVPKSKTWLEVFGTTSEADEIFMAWQYAQFVKYVVAAGKREYPIPMYVNAWLVQSPDQQPGLYPSGGPVPGVMDVWRAGAGNIDLFAPDIYLPNFNEVCESYTRSQNPLFIPEAVNESISGAQVFYAIGRFHAIGYSPFAIEDLNAGAPLQKSYAVLAQLSPLILAHSGMGEMVGILQPQNTHNAFMFDQYTFNVTSAEREPGDPDLPAYGLIIKTSPDHFVLAGAGLSIAFTSTSPEKPYAGIASVDEGRFGENRWISGRRLNGDETDGGKSVILRWRGPSIQRVALYTHN